jgi:hypothetical protein
MNCTCTICIVYYDLFHIQLSYDELIDQFNAIKCMYVCMYERM